jgi:hypothetical protein
MSDLLWERLAFVCISLMVLWLLVLMVAFILDVVVR